MNDIKAEIVHYPRIRVTIPITEGSIHGDEDEVQLELSEEEVEDLITELQNALADIEG
jgi:hypothetical protein